nr:hypothetical protein [Tanacetum cinerariifolium]
MSNTNNTMQTQTSNALHNAIMEAGSKDRSPMLTPGNYVQWKSRIKRYIDTKPNHELIHYCLQNPPYKYKWVDKEVQATEGGSVTTESYMENYKNVSQDIRDQLNAEAEAVQIILTGIDNDIYSTVDACPNACEMDGESLESYYSRFYKMMNEFVRNQCDSQELKTVSYHKLYDILKHHHNEVDKIRAKRLAHNANPLALVAQQQLVFHPQNHAAYYTQNSSTRSQQAATRNRGKAIVNSPAAIYDQEPFIVTKDDEMSKDKEIDKLMALISLSFKKIYKPTNNNLRTSSNTSSANQDNSLRINKGTGYDNQRTINVAGARENVGTPVVQKSGIQCYNCKKYGHVARECQKPKRARDAAYHKEKMLLYQELEAHYMYLVKLQEVTLDVADNYGPIFNTELGGHDDQDDADALANERDLLASLIEKLKCEIDDNKNCNKFLETSNKALVDKLKGEIEDFKIKNKSLESSNNHFKEANNKLSETKEMMYKDLKKFQAELDRRNDVKYASKKSTCYIHDLKGNDLLTGSRGTDLYSITLQDTSSPNPICLMARATSSQAWLWHRRLSYLNFDTINLLSKNHIVIGLPKVKFIKDHLLSFCELGKAKRKSFQTKITPSSKRRLQLLHMDLCGPMRVESINGKKYVLVIVDDYSRYTWTHFLRSKDETPKVLIDFLRLIQRGLHAQVRTVRTDKGAKFLNKYLHAYFSDEGIDNQTSVARTPEQNGIVERRNRTLVEAVRTMLSAAKVPLFFWTEAIATTCFTQNCSLVIPRHEKIPYHIINNQKPSVKFFHIFGTLCYIVRDGKNLDKMKEKGDACIFVGYSTQSRAYMMASDHVSSDLAPQCQSTALEHVSLSPDTQCQVNVPHAAETVITSNELDLLFSPMFAELLNGSSQVVSKSSAVTVADALHQCQQQHTTPLITLTTPEHTCQDPFQAPTVTSTENINQAKMNLENAQVADDEFINIFCTPIQDRGETSSRHVDSSNMNTFYQRYLSEHRCTKDHPLEQVIGNPYQSVRTRRQLESDGEMCIFALIVSQTKPKNIKEAMTDSAWIESMQEELYQFDRLDINQSPCGIFINQAKYAQEILKKHGMTSYDSIGTPMATKHLDADLSGPLVDQTKYQSSDKLVSWSSKKQDCTSMSSVEAEYVSLSACCAQVLWLRTQLTDYGFHFDKIPMYCDSKAAIAISCNLVQHLRT